MNECIKRTGRSGSNEKTKSRKGWGRWESVLIEQIYWSIVLLVILSVGGDVFANEKPFNWQQNHADVTEKGDIQLRQHSFRFVAGQNVRYIDYKDGNDSNDGKTKMTPWKHHPWDNNAVQNAAAAKRIDTYIFKGGVVYRGQMTVREQGKPGSPIRLTRDPSWGNGPAVIAGSEIINGFTKGADHPDIPEGEMVWKKNLDFATRALWMIQEDGTAFRIPLARTPNWISQPEDHKEQWWYWTNEGHHYKPPKGWSANDSKNLKGKPREFIEGALIYSEFGWVMGTPYPSPIKKFDPGEGRVLFEGWNGGTAGSSGKILSRYARYYLEDKPHYLDDPKGEYWFDKKGNGGTLYLRLPGGLDPNAVRIEVGRRHEIIGGTEYRHIEISGLDFRWITPPWQLTMLKWDFSIKPFGYRRDAKPSAIQIWGEAEDVRIANCRFEDVETGVHLKAIGKGKKIVNITVEDNTFIHNVVNAATFCSGHDWGFTWPIGVLDNVNLFRNYAKDIGFRPGRYNAGLAFNFIYPFRAHIAGNVIEHVGAQGINVHSGKSSGMRGDIPFIRILIHNNKVWKSMQNCCDYGGIEAWQHGPIYIFNNLSYDARGLQEYGRRVHKYKRGFGHAYYLDGGFKAYLFNNIAWGLSNDPSSKLVNCAAFQEIYSFQNMFFNNTAYNYAEGTRRQAPGGGRNKYLGNVFQDISSWVLWHSTPSKSEKEPNAADARQQLSKYDLSANAYDRNVFHSFSNCPYVKAAFGCYLPDGSWLGTPEVFKQMLKATNSLAVTLGTEDKYPSLVNPAKGDFRLKEESAGKDNGAMAFVPWALYGVAAEWNFYHRGGDHTDIIDEHWYARDYMGGRGTYYKRPIYSLKAVNVKPEDYVDGPLENFTKGALQLDPARKTYAKISNADISKPYTIKLSTVGGPGTKHDPKDITFKGDDLKTVSIYSGNFLIEVYFKAKGDGLLVSKKQGTGYDLRIKNGKALFTVEGPSGIKAELTSRVPLSDGAWKHLIAECDRTSKTITLYVDGKRDNTGPGIGSVSIANEADLFVGGSPEGEYLDATLEFMRISRGTLADAHTSIEELYEWELNGPFRFDMRGAAPKGNGRDAGALESY